MPCHAMPSVPLLHLPRPLSMDKIRGKATPLGMATAWNPTCWTSDEQTSARRDRYPFSSWVLVICILFVSHTIQLVFSELNSCRGGSPHHLFKWNIRPREGVLEYGARKLTYRGYLGLLYTCISSVLQKVNAKILSMVHL